MNGPGHPCPYCGSDDIAAVLLTDGEPSTASPFWIACPTDDSPACGCCSCGWTYGNWLEQYSG